MDAFRKCTAVFAVLIMILCTAPVVSVSFDTSDAFEDADGVLIYEVNPKGDYEGVTIRNYGSSAIDLRGYTISDCTIDKNNEGKITFQKSIKLNPGETITIAKSVSKDDTFTNRGNAYPMSSDIVKVTGNFVLSDSKDDVYLYDSNDKLLDAIYYGSIDVPSDAQWTGKTVTLRGDFFVQRAGAFDTDSADDWFSYVPGQTHNDFDPDLRYDAKVTPFLFPDSGGIPIYNALENATESVFIEIYMLTSKNVFALLCDLQESGVQVTLLLEGAPVGYDVGKDSSMICALIDLGGEVRLIGGTSNDRFENMHAKYAVIDRDTVIVTSENWTADNCNGSIDDDPYKGNDGNRGWGAIVESTGYADFMMDVFDNDYSLDYGDTQDYLDKYPYSKPSTLTYVAPEKKDFESYDVQVTPVLSNDSSYDAMEYYISNANERVYSQQQSLTSYYATLEESSPVMMMAKRASAGVDAKFILSSGIGSANNETTKKLVNDINLKTLVSAATMGSPYVHNKGLICDDSVWVSSINWTPTSVNNNRECCVVIHSAEVSDLFAEAFDRDFERNYTFDGFKIDISGIDRSFESGAEVTFQVGISPSGNYSYVWDLGDGSEPITSKVPRITARPMDGAHILTITVTDLDNNNTQKVTVSYYIGEGGGDGSKSDIDIKGLIDEYGKYLIPLIVIILGIIAAATRSGKNKKKSSGKGSKGKKKK